MFKFKLLQKPEIKGLLERPKNWQKNKFFQLILIVFFSTVFGFLVGVLFIYLINNHFGFLLKDIKPEILAPIITKEEAEQEIIEEKEIKEAIDFLITKEEAVIRVVEKVSPAVVNVVATRDLPAIISPFGFEFGFPERGQERREVGWGSGFIVSADGLILTNRHVVEDERAEYTVVLNNGQEFSAQVIARDRARDLALLRIRSEKPLPIVKLGDSNALRPGQTVIAIGNVLGEFQNSISKGVVSGLGRTVTARGGGLVMRMEDIIQTDAAINPGNSGGPLLNLRGEVIGINTAMAIGAENIGFSIPINQAKEAIEEVKKYGRILHPFLGVNWTSINERIQRENNLPVDYGAWVVRGQRGETAIFPDSPAERAGIREGDIILEFNQEKITPENSLARIIVKYNPGDRVVLKILRDGRERTIEVVLGEME